MAKKNNSDFFGEIKIQHADITLAKIDSFHPKVKSHSDIESNLEYLLDSVTQISEDYFHGFLKMHPLWVVKEGGRYLCISNLRLFKIAKIKLASTTEISCFLLSENNEELITKIATTDFYLSHLLWSLRPVDSDEQICRAWQALDDVKKQILPDIKQQTTLASLMNVSRKKAYLKRKKQIKPDFTDTN